MIDTQRGLMTKAAVIFIILLMVLTMMPKEANAAVTQMEVDVGAQKVYYFEFPEGYYYKTTCTTADTDVVKITALQNGSYYYGIKSAYRFKGLKTGTATLTIKVMAYREMMDPDSYAFTKTYKKTINVKQAAGSAVVTQKPSGTTTQKPATQKTPVQKQKTGAKKPVVKKAPKAYYMNVTSTYKNVNQFRTKKSNQWYWKKGNKSKQYVYGLKKLKRDKTLENIAKTRAKEQWTQYYVNGLVTHTRPNGKSCFSVFPKSMKNKYKCENLAFYYTSSKEVVEAWAEKNNKYSGQGHRRNMLSTKVKRIGIACYVKNGYTCWAMVMTQ